ncbi:hypothetical protein AAL_04370 [Moelleriella libera RCEF 2490]|uniref:F-box domain-containing protein n=1 Tax=Moelleriella libera RCEF 2490 TaxID=1081109 RepID=A0A168C2U1_9HYPO|nr:hypothetical protein AAL_04370 [Moelleriella libera RCEF 2490]
MGQRISCRPRSPAALPIPLDPPFLKLPNQIVFLIMDQLDVYPESILSLSLSCKSLFFALERHVAKVKHLHWRERLAFMEKDFSDEYYHCTTCVKIHHFSSE